jgi:hypothetical protein
VSAQTSSTVLARVGRQLPPSLARTRSTLLLLRALASLTRQQPPSLARAGRSNLLLFRPLRSRANNLLLLRPLRSRANNLLLLRPLRSRANNLRLLRPLRSRANNLILLRPLRSRANSLPPSLALASAAHFPHLASAHVRSGLPRAPRGDDAHVDALLEPPPPRRDGRPVVAGREGFRVLRDVIQSLVAPAHGQAHAQLGVSREHDPQIRVLRDFYPVPARAKSWAKSWG